MLKNFYKNEIGSNNVIVGGDYTVFQKHLSKNDVFNIFKNMCNYYFNKNFESYKMRLHNFILENLPYYDWSPEEEQEFFIILGHTSTFLEEQINYYKAAIDLLPDSIESKKLKWLYIRCKIINFFREFFQIKKY
jgi:hypothetical protein|nr:MAG TPA: hypothetical protein [Caudoviricetes sp.]